MKRLTIPRVVVAVAAAAAASAVVVTLQAQSAGTTTADIQAGFANPAKWLSVHGDYTGQRHSPLTQITPANAAQLTPVWTFQTGGVQGQFEATPIVIDGVLYYTGPQNHAWAVDAKTGKEVWHYQRTLVAGLKVCCGPVNRGFAVYGDKLYMTTLDSHLLALDMKTGKVVWEVEVADFKLGYASTPAPLVVKDKLIVGIAGGEYANRGFLDAYEPATGKRGKAPTPAPRGKTTASKPR